MKNNTLSSESFADSAGSAVRMDFRHLVPYQKRRFVPAGLSLTDSKAVQPFYQRLLEKEIHSAQELEEWLLDRSELEAALSQEGTILYIRMTCQTDDKDRAKSYMDFIETVMPVVKDLGQQLNEKYLKEIESFPLERLRYEVYTRAVRADVELFVKENIALQTQEQLLSQEYQTLCGAMTVEFEGKERTLPEAGKFLLEPDRGLRERAWRVISQRRLRDKDRLEEIFDKMLSLRHQMAQNVGCAHYGQYKFLALHRFDYTEHDCRKYHQSIEKFVVPLWKILQERRLARMRLPAAGTEIPRLRPWDMSVDPLGRPPLRPFQRPEELIQGCAQIFKQLDLELGEKFAGMADLGLLDVESRKGKAPGGYQSTLDEARNPFIFMNAVGTEDDVRTLLHEAGHAFHVTACAADPLLDYRHGPMEFNEVASMGMELLAEPYLSVFYNPQDQERSISHHLESVIFTLVWVATIDAFQHWIYEHPRHNADQRRQAWLEIHHRFGGDVVDWSGLEEEHAFLWHRQLHIFEAPFYYIEYGIAQLGALQLWVLAQKDPQEALSRYKRALSLGGSRPLPEIYKTAGIRFDFSAHTIVPLVETVQSKLKIAPPARLGV